MDQTPWMASCLLPVAIAPHQSIQSIQSSKLHKALDHVLDGAMAVSVHLPAVVDYTHRLPGLFSRQLSTTPVIQAQGATLATPNSHNGINPPPNPPPQPPLPPRRAMACYSQQPLQHFRCLRDIKESQARLAVMRIHHCP